MQLRLDDGQSCVGVGKSSNSKAWADSVQSDLASSLYFIRNYIRFLLLPFSFRFTLSSGRYRSVGWPRRSFPDKKGKNATSFPRDQKAQPASAILEAQLPDPWMPMALPVT